MHIGIPREIKEMENRVGVTPAGVSELVGEDHRVLVEKTLELEVVSVMRNIGRPEQV